MAPAEEGSSLNGPWRCLVLPLTDGTAEVIPEALLLRMCAATQR